MGLKLCKVRRLFADKWGEKAVIGEAGYPGLDCGATWNGLKGDFSFQKPLSRGDPMANSDVIVSESAMDYPEHEKTYRLFLSLVKWGTIFCIGAVILLAIFTL
jgi:hypothetical protein